MRVAICDDDNRMSERLGQIVKKVFADAQIQTYEDGKVLLAEHAVNPYQIALLDIEMPAMDGMTLAEKLRKKDDGLLLIFVTDYSEMVYRSLSHAPLRFVRKNHIEDELEEALEAAKKIMIKRERVYIIGEKGIRTALPLSKIAYIEVNNHKATIYAEEREYKLRKTMRELQTVLEPDGFIRTHVAYLVNMEHIYCIGDSYVKLQNGVEVPISRGYKKAVRDQFFSYIGGHSL